MAVVQTAWAGQRLFVQSADPPEICHGRIMHAGLFAENTCEEQGPVRDTLVGLHVDLQESSVPMLKICQHVPGHFRCDVLGRQRLPRALSQEANATHRSDRRVASWAKGPETVMT